MSTKMLIRPAIPDDETASQAAAAVDALKRISREIPSDTVLTVQLADNGAEAAKLPAAAVSLLLGVLEPVAQGGIAAVVAPEDEISIHLTADLLDVSCAYVEELLDNGKIPCRTEDGQRRIRVSDLLEYRRIDYARRREAVDELTRETQLLGFDYC